MFLQTPPLKGTWRAGASNGPPKSVFFNALALSWLGMPQPEAKRARKEEPDFKLMLQEGSHVLKTYSQGPPTRQLLEKMAVSPINRSGMGVNGRHCHDLFHKIFHKDGLCVWRYTRGLALAPNPKDPLENARFTNEMVSKQHDMLASVTMEAHPGSFSKTHLWMGQFTAKQGSFKYYKDGTPMIPNPADPEMQMTMQYGLFYEILAWEAFEKHPDAIKFLMQGENADASDALRNTEVAMIKEYFVECKRVVLRGAMTLWDCVSEIVPENAYSAEYRKAACNLAVRLMEPQIFWLVDIYQHHVNPKERIIGAAQMTAVSKMCVQCPWCKLAIVVANLVSDSVVQDKDKGSGQGPSVGASVPQSSLAALKTNKSLSETVWNWLESTIQAVIEKQYTRDKLVKCDGHTLLHLGWYWGISFANHDACFAT